MVPVRLFVASLLGWLHGEEHKMVEYLREENRVLKAQLRSRRVQLTDDERRRLAVLGANLGRHAANFGVLLDADSGFGRWPNHLGRYRASRSQENVPILPLHFGASAVDLKNATSLA